MGHDPEEFGPALTVLGQREKGTARLTEAIATLHGALQETTRERVPLQWAFIQNNLGGALRVLGERESGTMRLEEAVTAYREALQEQTRARMPLQWAMNQRGLTFNPHLEKRKSRGRNRSQAMAHGLNQNASQTEV